MVPAREIDGHGLSPAGEAERVPGAALDPVGARAAVERVVLLAAGEGVVAGAAFEAGPDPERRR